MKICMIVKIVSCVEIYGCNGTKHLQYVFYNNLPYNTFEGVKSVYDNSETMARYMNRMVKTYGRNMRNFVE